MRRRPRAERDVPAALTPALRSARRVVPIPYWPASSEWFDAVLHASQPTRLIGAGEVRRRVEHRVALDGPGHERRLDVAEREVGARDRPPHRREQRREVVAAAAAERERPPGHRRVDQEVTGGGDGQPDRPDRLRGGTRGPAQAHDGGEQCEQLPHQSTSCSSITP